MTQKPLEELTEPELIFMIECYLQELKRRKIHAEYLAEDDDNRIHLIYPYPIDNGWVFDDEGRNFQREPFPGDMSEIIDVCLKSSGMERKKFGLFFTSWFAPKYDILFERTNKPVLDGKYYKIREGPQDIVGKEVWLFPAFLKYFREYPYQIIVKMQAIKK